MSLFKSNDRAPLAARLRPRSDQALVGQEHIWAPERPLWNLVHEDQFHALLFWGPPGTGKTSLAHVIGCMTERQVAWMSAVRDGVKEIRAVIAASKAALDAGERAHLMFMDEIHRLSKNQQDSLLPALEEGHIKFVGATTENPSFEVNAAVLSRCLVFGFRSIPTDRLVALLSRAIRDINESRQLSEAVLQAIADAAHGDGRRALTLLEAVLGSLPESLTQVDLEHVQSVAADLGLRFDRDGEQHYDTASAMIKSIRGSHPDAALHYMARMIAGGEDPVFIARRLVIAASEDIGNANPTALLLAQSGMDAVHKIGMPEARIVLGQVVTYLASSPKSNRAYLAIDQALSDVKEHGDLPIPLNLRNAPTKFMTNIGYGKNYRYAHDDPEGSREMPYLPEELQDACYYQPSEVGVEAQLKRNLAQLKPKPSASRQN